jgi:hypothetical protein
MNMRFGNLSVLSALPVMAGALLAGCGSMDSGKGAPFRTELMALRITELDYHPRDEGVVSGDEYEFIEIKNTGATPLSLDGVALTDGVDYEFPDGTTLDAGRFLVLASNPARFADRYGFKPFGAYEGKLNNAGEEVVLSDKRSGERICAVAYSDRDPWPFQADGGGFSLVPAAADTSARGWRASFEVDGSPGKDDPAAVLVNEALTHTDLPDKDAIELFNPNDASMDVSGWLLTDDRSVPGKFVIPEGSVLPPKGYLVFDADDFDPDSASPASFNLNSHGEEVFLMADSSGCGSRYCHGFTFGEQENGVTYGRYVTGNGEERFPSQKEATLGRANAGPRVGPVVISEVMYHPASDSNEFLEVTNLLDVSVNMFDKLNPKNTWRIDGIKFAFPEGVTLAAGETVVIIPDTTSESAFRKAYDMPSATRIFRMEGTLSNSSDTLDLLKPEEPFVSGAKTVNPYMSVDKLAYSDRAPWPVEADAGKLSLGRIDLKGFSDDPANWKAVGPTPGRLP